MAQDFIRPAKRRVQIFTKPAGVGFTTAGGTALSNATATQQDATRIQNVPAGTYDSITFYADWTVVNKNTQFGLYSEVAGAPSALLANSLAAQAAEPTTRPGWVTLRFTSPVVLAAGNYWLSIPGNVGPRDVWYNAGSAGDSFEGGTGVVAGVSLPASWAGGASGSKQLSGYLNPSQTFTPPRTPMMVLVTMVGAGGGGGGSSDQTSVPQGACGGGGAGEAILQQPFFILSGTVLVGVGVPGSGGLGAIATGNGSSGSRGGNSSFGKLEVRGGGPAIGSTGSTGQGGGSGGGGTAGGGTGGGAGVAAASNYPILPGGSGGGGGSNNGRGGHGGNTVSNMKLGTSTSIATTDPPFSGGAGGDSATSPSKSGGGGGGGGNILGKGGAGGIGAIATATGAAGSDAVGYGAGGGGAGGQNVINTAGNPGGAGGAGIVIVEWDE